MLTDSEKRKKKLIKYLADYIDHEEQKCASDGEYWSEALLEEWIEQGIDAFESIEDMEVFVV